MTCIFVAGQGLIKGTIAEHGSVGSRIWGGPLFYSGKLKKRKGMK